MLKQVCICLIKSIHMLKCKCKCAHTQLKVCTCSSVRMHMLKCKHAYAQVKVCTCSSAIVHMLKWQHVHVHIGCYAYSEFLRDGSCFCPECWTFYKSSPLPLFVAMNSSIQPNACVVKTCLFEELSAMHMRRLVQPERRSLQKHIFGERILQLQT